MAHADSLYPRDYDSARVAYDSTIVVARLDGDSVTLARTLTSRGNAAWRLGRYDEAQRLGTEALALKQRLHLERDLAKSYGGLGLLAQARGRYEEAEPLLRSALAAAQAVNDSGFIARANNNLGLLHTDLGEFARARTELQTALAMAAARGERIVEVSAAINLGKLELEVGNPSAAIPWLRDARTRAAALSSAVNEENALGQLARADASRGEPALAIAHLDSALAIARAHGLKEPETDDLELMAELYQSAGQHRRSLVYLMRARALSDSLGMLTKLAHVSLAESRAYAALGNLPAALGRATALIDRLRREGARSDELDAQLLAAELSQRHGDSVGARARLDSASAIATSLGVGLAHVRVALARARVLDAAARANEVVSALRAIAPDSALLTADEQAEREGLLARAQLSLGNVDSAVAAGRRAVAGVERIRGRMNTGELRTGYTADRATIYADLVLALLQRGAVDEALRVADAARGRTLTERLGTETRALPAASRREVAELRELLARIEVLTARLRATDSAHTPERGAGPALASTLTRQLADARREYESRIVRVAQSESDASILGATTLDVGDIRRSLARDEALVEFFSIRDRLVTFVVTGDRVQWVSSPMGSDELAERVRSARSVIASRTSENEKPLRALYAQLVAPLERERMLAGMHALVVVPHGALAYLPFAALVRDATPSRYLVEDYSILTLASASALPALRRRAASATTVAASVLAPLPTELPGSREEASIVAAAYGGTRPIIGNGATEGALRTALGRSAVVHVASHGVFDAGSPMFSGIKLVAVSDSLRDDDGRMEAHEVLALVVRSHLVFLSGCETALGPSWSTGFERTEDYVTLAQAFLFAGARNVVATLWRIEDRSAAVLAGSFYRALPGSSPAEALARAQRTLIRTERYRRPYYWAAYLVSGSGCDQCNASRVASAP
jgi:CHAT domain-containing protein/tetratricopeptide (TPR) repeat protein